MAPPLYPVPPECLFAAWREAVSGRPWAMLIGGDEFRLLLLAQDRTTLLRFVDDVSVRVLAAPDGRSTSAAYGRSNGGLAIWAPTAGDSRPGPRPSVPPSATLEATTQRTQGTVPHPGGRRSNSKLLGRGLGRRGDLGQRGVRRACRVAALLEARLHSADVGP